MGADGGSHGHGASDDCDAQPRDGATSGQHKKLLWSGGGASAAGGAERETQRTVDSLVCLPTNNQTMAINQNKRKRYTEPSQRQHSSRSSQPQDESSSAGEQDFGNQSLPVAVLPLDFDGVPTDGSQYLAMVRAEAATHPSVYLAASNPYAVASTSKAANIKPENDGHRAQELDLPDEPSRQAFLERFKAVRQALSHLPQENPPMSFNNRGRVPKIKFTPAANRSWYKFIFRRDRPVDDDGNVLPPTSTRQDAPDPEDDADDDHDGEGRLTESESTQNNDSRSPTFGLLQHFTTGHYLSLLDAIPYWIPIPHHLIDGDEQAQAQAQSSLSSALHPVISQWCFAILARLDTRLTSDEISSLRVLARSCIAAVAMRRAAGHVPSPAQESGAWIIVTIIAGIWGQTDLWMDAGQDMARVASGASVAEQV